MDVQAGPQTSTAGAKQAASQLAYHVIGRNPRTWAIVFGAMVLTILLLIIVIVTYVGKYKDCEASRKGTMIGTDPLGNLNTGSNNPMWHLQSGDAGWGGPMHSTYQMGEGRVWGSSAEGGHDMVVAPVKQHRCGPGVGPAASAEASTLVGAQALAPVSAKGMSDDELTRVMGGAE